MVIFHCSCWLSAIIAMVTVTWAQLPIPCTDLQPVYLLELATETERNLGNSVMSQRHLSAGVEIVYDAEGSTHAYRFTPRASALAFPASSVFKYCQYFPEEFSLLVTLRLTEKDLFGEHCIFALMDRGLLKQLLMVPGADAAVGACPVSAPAFPEFTVSFHDLPTVSSTTYDGQSVCSWRETGKLWFDIYDKILRVCYSGIWQTILLPPEERREKRVDYFVWQQDIVTAAPTIDIEIFRIPNEGLFMAFASFSEKREVKKQQSSIFQWSKGRFRMFQSLYTLGAQAWEHFSIDNEFFLAVANQGPRRDRPSKSVIYRWNRKKRKFKVHQELVTWTARDVEYFSIEGGHYIAIANHVMGQNHTIPSDIYIWVEAEKRFELTQQIATVGAYDWTHFLVGKYHFLVVANSFTGLPHSTTRTHSVIYLWQNGHFVQFQTLLTTGATDWEYFRVHDDLFLVVANAFNYGPHITEETDRYRTNSTIYILNKVRKQFDVYQNIVTFSAVDWESFTIGDDVYLAVSNAQQDGADEGVPRDHYTSVIYRWQGVEKFVAKHYLETLPSADWEVYSMAGHVYLIYANAKDSLSQVYRVKFV